MRYKRKSTRININKKVSVVLDKEGEEFTCKLKDRSFNGLLIECGRQLDLDEKILLKKIILFIGGQENQEAEVNYGVKVVKVLPMAPDAFQCGLQFLNTSDNYQFSRNLGLQQDLRRANPNQIISNFCHLNMGH